MLLLLFQTSEAQRKRREQVLTFGTSQSATELFGAAVQELVNTVSYKDAKMSAGLLINYDHCLKNRVSLGIGFSQQQLKLTYTDTTFLPTGGYVADTYVDRITRINTGLRALYHFRKAPKNVDGYFGLRFSFTKWTQESSNPNVTAGTWNFDDLFGQGRMRYQALFGFRYYPWKKFGLNTEFAIGPPYFLLVGMNWKWGKDRRTEEEKKKEKEKGKEKGKGKGKEKEKEKVTPPQDEDYNKPK